MTKKPTTIDKLKAQREKLDLQLQIKALQARKSFAESDKTRKRHYEGAGRNRRTEGWKTPRMSGPVTTIAQSLPLLRERSRDIIRNTGYGKSAMQTIVSGMVGYGVQTAIVNTQGTQSAKLQSIWDAWSETTACDARGICTLGGLQMQAIRMWAESGECFFRRVIKRDWKPGEFPYQIQMIEPELLDITKDYRDKNIRQGIEFDEYGAPIAYWVYPEHPLEARGAIESVRIPATEMGHMYFVERAGQLRGVPLLAPVIVKMHDLGDYEDAQLERQRLSACYMAFITNMDGDPSEVRQDADMLIERIEPGIIQPLKIGEAVDFANPPGPQGYTDYVKTILHGIAAGIGITYEDLTGDYSQVSWSSGRLARLKYYANLDAWQWQMFVPMFCDKIWQWFKDGCTLLGMATANTSARYTLPRRPVADINEYKARMNEVRAGFKSIQEAQRENGYRPEDILLENKEFFDQANAMGLVFDTDPSKVSSYGQAQQQPATDTQNE